MKETDRRRGSNNKVKSNPARPDTRDGRPQVKNGGRNLKVKQSGVKPSSDKPTTTKLVNDLETGADSSEVSENVVIDSLNDCYGAEKYEKHGNGNFISDSNDVEITNGSNVEISNDSLSSQGHLQTTDEEKVEKNLQAKSLPDNLKDMKVHPKPLSDSSEGAEDQSLEQDKDIGILDETSNSTEENEEEEQFAFDRKVKEMETRIMNLKSELREVAALEIALYSVVPDHGSSTHKVHTPARRLSRLYIYACKHWSQDKRASVARNTVSGLVLVSKSCGNDVSRLTFWLSNTVVLRKIISQTFENSCQSSALEKAFDSNGGETKPSRLKLKTGSASNSLNKQTSLQFVDDWQETRTFSAALEKVESWIFSRVVESIWWQTLTPNMQPHVVDSIKNKGAGKLLCQVTGDQKHGNFSINLWKNAFHDALKRLCPVRAGGHECGCLPVLPRKVMGQCIGRLDVAMFNAILRESMHEIPTDPVSDPIVESKVLPIPAGDLSFGSGAQLKNSVGSWERWLSEFLGIDTDDSINDETQSQDEDDEGELKPFPLLNSLSDLLMLPKDMLMDRTVRLEVCPLISLPLVKRILCNFCPDELCPDPVPGAVLEALNTECIIEQRLSGNSIGGFPYPAAPVMYTPPSSSEVAEKITKASANSQLSRSASAVQRKGYASDEELDELQSCLAGIVEKLPSSPTAELNGYEDDELNYSGGNTRYDLLREVWQPS